MPQYKLTYFNVRGRGELIRLVFAYADQEYEDFRFEMAQWPEFKPSKSISVVYLRHTPSFSKQFKAFNPLRNRNAFQAGTDP